MWVTFSFDEIKGQYFAVAVGNNENKFGIYADLRKLKEQIEGFPACLCQSCDSYIQAHQYLEQYLQKNIGNETMETTTTALAVT
jgi:viroplasmin and RNaseH domain-containing protein